MTKIVQPTSAPLSTILMTQKVSFSENTVGQYNDTQAGLWCFQSIRQIKENLKILGV